MQKCRWLVVGAVALVASLPLSAQDKAKLDWKLAKDAVSYQELTTTTTQNMKVMGQDVSQKQSQTFYFSWTPKEQDKDGNWTIIQKIIGVKMTITINDQTISFDSTNPGTQSSALAEFFKALVDTEFKLTVDKGLKVTKVEGRDDFIKRLGTANAQMEPLLKSILSDDALKQMADPTFGFLPGKEVSKGEEWKKPTELKLGPIGSYTNTYTYKYEGKEGDLQKISVAQALAYTAPTEGGQGLPFKIKAGDLKSKDATGTILFDEAKGRVAKMTLTLKLEGTLDIEIGGTSTKVELKQEQTTTSTMSDANPIKK